MTRTATKPNSLVVAFVPEGSAVEDDMRATLTACAARFFSVSPSRWRRPVAPVYRRPQIGWCGSACG